MDNQCDWNDIEMEKSARIDGREFIFMLYVDGEVSARTKDGDVMTEWERISAMEICNCIFRLKKSETIFSKDGVIFIKGV